MSERTSGATEAASERMSRHVVAADGDAVDSLDKSQMRYHKDESSPPNRAKLLKE